MRHLFPTKSKEENEFLRAVARNIKADSVLVEKAMTSLVDGLYNGTFF